MSEIVITELYKKFPGKKGRIVEALKGLSLAIDKGEVFGFVGPNGAGKTTTIKILLGLIKPTSGKASIKGYGIESPISRKEVGYLPENPLFYDYLTAQEYLLFVGKTFGMSNAQLKQRIEEVLKLLDLWEARNRPMRGYSKGMVQRLGLAQVLVHDPDVYILDEPMSGLDPVGRALVKNIILDLKQKGKTVFFSTHITSDVEAVCDRVGIIYQGVLCRLEKVESLLREGILGYHVRIKSSSEQTDIYVPKENFSNFIKDTLTSGRELVLMEPKRKDLESFFLETVNGTALEE